MLYPWVSIHSLAEDMSRHVCSQKRAIQLGVVFGQGPIQHASKASTEVLRQSTEAGLLCFCKWNTWALKDTKSQPLTKHKTQLGLKHNLPPYIQRSRNGVRGQKGLAQGDSSQAGHSDFFLPLFCYAQKKGTLFWGLVFW